MESRNVHCRPYPVMHKMRAFMRGLPYSPLVEVAREGIGRKHSLSSFEEFTYANRLAEHAPSGFLCHVLEKGCSKTIQDIFAPALKKRFEEKLRFMSLISYSLWEGGHGVSTFHRACGWDAHEIAGLRSRVAKTLASGKLTSPVAQVNLVSILRHYNIVDGHFGTKVPELANHELTVLKSPNAPDNLKRVVISEMADSLSIAKKGLRGLPLTPYD